MINFKKVTIIFYKLALRILSIAGLLVTLLLGAVLYFIIFQVPINYFNNYIESKIFYNLVTIKNIYVKWDYELRTPVLVLEDINYNNNVAFHLKQAGISFSLKKLIFQHQFLPTYVHLDGFNLYIKRTTKNNFLFNVINLPNKSIDDFINYNKIPNISKNAIKKDNLPNGYLSSLGAVSVDDLLKHGAYGVFEEFRHKYKILDYINTIKLTNSLVEFQDEINKQNFKLYIQDLKTDYNKKKNNILTSLNAKVMSSNLKLPPVFFNLTLSTNRKKQLFFNYNIDNIPPQQLITYIKQIKNLNIFKKVQTAGLFVDVDAQGLYEFSKGLKSLNTKVNLSKGELFIKGYLKHKILVNKLTVNSDYNGDSHVLNISSLNLSLQKGGKVVPSFVNSNININQLNLSSSINLDNNHWKVNKANVNLSNNIIDFKASGDGKQNINLTVKSDNKINFKNLNEIWPKALAPKVRGWILKNVYKGSIEDFKVSTDMIYDKKVTLKSVNGDANIQNLQIRYVKGMPYAIVPKVHLSFNKSGLKISYLSGVTGNVESKTGEVDFTYLDDNSPALTFNMQAEGKLVKVLNFINNKPLELLNKAKLSSDRFDGTVAGNVKFIYNFKVKKIQNLLIQLVAHNFEFKNAFKDKNISNADINLKVDDEHLLAYGKGDFANINTDLFLDVSWLPSTPYLVKVGANSKNIPIATLKELDVIPQALKDKLFGDANLSLEINILKNSKNKDVKASLDLRNSELKNLPIINYSKSVGKPLKANINLTLANDKVLRIDRLNILANDLNTKLKFNFNKDGSTNVLINSFNLMNKADISGYLFLADKDIKANISGQFLDVGWFLNNLNNNKNKDNNKNKKEKSDENILNDGMLTKIYDKEDQNSSNSMLSKNYDIVVKVKKAVSNNVHINNLYFNLELFDKRLNSLVTSATFSDNKNITIVYDKGKNKIAFNLAHIDKIMQFLNLKSKFKDGSVVGMINFQQDDANNVLTSGNIKLKSFSLGVIPFNSATLSFMGNNNSFNILNLNLKGNVVGGNLRGNFDIYSKMLNLYGFISPIWSASSLLLKIPVLGDFLSSNFAQSLLSYTVNKNNTKNRGIVNIGFKAYGKINNLKYEYGKYKNNLIVVQPQNDDK